MDLLQGIPKTKKSSPLILSVLNPPPKTHLREVSSPSSEYSLYLNTQKKVFLAAYTTVIQKSKLLANLQIYEWRHQTQFPIVRTAFVEVKENQSSQNPNVQITAFTEYCPLKLTLIYEMPLGQTLYLLKQTMLGFQRLYNRFGCFEIMSSMITISEKGFCRVWLNENFALNSFAKKDFNQSKMVNKIITIIESHSQITKATKKLFAFLKNCTSFLAALRAIELFVKQSKIFVPTKFLTTSSPSKESSRVEAPGLLKKNLFESDGSALISRLSIKDEKLGKFKDMGKEDFRSNCKDRKNSSSPLQFKRLKSEQNIQDFQSVMNKMMKISDLDTAHTRIRNHTPNKFNGSLSKQISNKNVDDQDKSKKKRPGWIEQSSYIMGEEELSQKQSDKKRKELTQSEAFSVGPLNSASSRKYSCKISPDKKTKSPSKNNTMFNKKKIDMNYFTQFEHVLGEPQVQSEKKIKEEDEEKFREEVSGSVLKTNGWVAKVSGLLDMPANLEESFHEGQEQNFVNKQIKLEKLGNVGRQQMLMSILHEEIEDLL